MKAFIAATFLCCGLVYAETPLLARARPFSPVIAVAAVFLLVRNSKTAVLALVPIALCADGVQTRQDNQQRALLGNDPVARHLIVGYTDPDAMRALLERNALRGIFVTARNARGKNVEQLAQEIASFQAIARAHGRPPLLVTADQEGGSVSRLSGPLPLRETPGRAQDPGWLATEQALDLQRVGVNMNFAPVVDLKTSPLSTLRDRHSQIYERAISNDAQVVSRATAAYTEASLRAGVLPVAKHFPGLGRVTADTHLNNAHLDIDTDLLAEQDWAPYRTLAKGSAVMVGHVVLDRVDPNAPASLSRAVVTEVLRGRLGFDGLVVTDDLCMSPTYFAEGGPVRSYERARAAGVDAVLVAYDVAVVYDVLAHAH